jgi:hypothetical protein
MVPIGSLLVIRNKRYVVVNQYPVANNQLNYALVDAHYINSPHLYTSEFESDHAFFLTDNELKHNGARVIDGPNVQAQRSTH